MSGLGSLYTRLKQRRVMQSLSSNSEVESIRYTKENNISTGIITTDVPSVSLILLHRLLEAHRLQCYFIIETLTYMLDYSRVLNKNTYRSSKTLCFRHEQ